MRVVLVLAALAGCHVTTRTELSQTRVIRTELRRQDARATPATIALTETGTLRFVEGLVCATDEVVEIDPAVQVTRRANLAAFIVGLVAVTAGSIAAVSGASGDDPGGSPLTWGGAALAAAGLPFAVGPWLGNGSSVVTGETRTEARTGAEAACGVRSTGATAATLSIGDRRVHGAVDADGGFAVPAFSWIDAFAIDGSDAFAVHAELTHGTTRGLDGVIEARALVATRDAFLTAAGIDGRVLPLRQVPRISLDGVVITQTGAGVDYLTIKLAVTNTGPGDVWQLRARVSAELSELDGRMIYIGHIPPKSGTGGHAVIPLSRDTYRLVVGRNLAISIQLADAHRTVSELPIRWDGIPIAAIAP